MGSTSYGGDGAKALREFNTLRLSHGMKRTSYVEINFAGTAPRDHWSRDVHKLLEELRAKPYKYQATQCDDGKWMVHTAGDVICFAEEHDAEDKAKLVAKALNQIGA